MMTLTEIENRLNVLLTEYQTLWSDVQSRNDRQNKFLQIHVTVLTAIIGVALTTKPEYFWIVMLIPIESSIFGLWFNANSLTILRIVEYLLCVTEKQIKEALKESDKKYHNKKIEFMSWGIFYRSSKNNIFQNDLIYRFLVLITFGGPSLICTFAFRKYNGLNVNTRMIWMQELYIIDFIFLILFFILMALVFYQTYKVSTKANNQQYTESSVNSGHGEAAENLS